MQCYFWQRDVPAKWGWDGMKLLLAWLQRTGFCSVLATLSARRVRHPCDARPPRWQAGVLKRNKGAITVTNLAQVRTLQAHSHSCLQSEHRPASRSTRSCGSKQSKTVLVTPAYAPHRDGGAKSAQSPTRSNRTTEPSGSNRFEVCPQNHLSSSRHNHNYTLNNSSRSSYELQRRGVDADNMSFQ